MIKLTTLNKKIVLLHRELAKLKKSLKQEK